VAELSKTTPEDLPSSSEALSEATAPLDYAEIVRFLIGPFLDSPEALRIHCESSRSGRVLIRLAVEGEQKGKVFGRGGRNIQAVRTTIQAIAKATNQKVHLDVYGSDSGHGRGERSSSGQRRSSGRPSRPPRPRPNRSSDRS